MNAVPPDLPRRNSRRPTADEVTVDYHRDLIARVEGDCVETVLRDQLFWMCELAGSLSAEQIDRVHAPYRWTVRQVIEHCVVAERVFGYRMLRIAAGDETPLAGFDENAYVDARFGLGNLSHLVSELGHLRQSNLMLLMRIVPKAWNRIAIVSGHSMSVRAIAWVAAGHLHHHFEIIEKRCDVQVKRKPSIQNRCGTV